MNLRRAFTLIEMLVVIIIITSILLIAVPSFQSMLNNSQAALADTMLKSGLRSGKDAALRSSGDQDSAVVFFFAPGGRLTMGIYIKAGSLNDLDGAGNVVRRDIFVPSGINEPLQLPRGWMVRGYAPANSTSDGSNDSTSDPATQWYEPYPNRPKNADEPNWVFPETDFYDRSRSDVGEYRQTFMVRFQAGTGIMKMGSAETCLIFAPGPNAQWRNNGVFANYRADQTDDALRFVTRILNAPAGGGGPTVVTDANRRELLGWKSSDMVLTRAVGQLALYDESKLAAALGVRVDRFSQSLYLPFDPGSPAPPSLPPRPSNFASYSRDINRWISGDTNLDGLHRPNGAAGEVLDAPEARIFTVDRYTGALQAVEVQ